MIIVVRIDLNLQRKVVRHLKSEVIFAAREKSRDPPGEEIQHSTLIHKAVVGKSGNAESYK